MKHFKTMLRMFTVLAILALFTLPVMAEDLNVYPTETTSGEAIPGDSLMALVSTDPVPTFTTGNTGIDLIISYEGFFSEPYQDTNGLAIGYGSSYTKAQTFFGENCAPITEEQARTLMMDDLASTETYLNRYLTNNSITVNQNQFDALMSFTYNVGIGWLYGQNSDGTPYKIQAMLLDDPATWTKERAQEAFGSWVKAGGVVLQGLVQRRKAEANLFCTPYTESETPEDEPTSTSVFSDVPESAWYYDEVMSVYDLGLMNGMGNGTFQPESTLTRAQMVKILCNFEGITDLSQDVDTGFSDVPAGQWYAGPIAWAVEKGYVNGMGDGTFQPNSPITREQLCTILARYLTDKGFAVDGTVGTFTDDAEMSDFARESIYFCSTLGLIQGMGDGSFSPKAGATRAQAAAVLLRMCELG